MSKFRRHSNTFYRVKIRRRSFLQAICLSRERLLEDSPKADILKVIGSVHKTGRGGGHFPAGLTGLTGLAMLAYAAQ